MANYKKFKLLRCATYLLSVFSVIQCQYSSENCAIDKGICTLLTNCPPLLREVKNAGSPMPIELRRKLKNIMCGFENDDPLVCCPLQINDQVTLKDSSFEITTFDSDKDNPTLNKFDGDVTKYKGPADVSNHPKIDLLPTNCGISDSNRIIGGNSTGLYEMPWMALIAYNTPSGIELNCGGTIINEWYVLTAAHCVSFLGNRLKLDHVVLGEYDVSTDPDCETIADEKDCAPRILNITIAKVISHPGYSPQNLYDDIALIRLSDRVKLVGDGLRPICLPMTPDLQSEKLIGVKGEVAGWGATDTGPHSSKLQSVAIPFLKNQECEKAYGNKISEKQMCAGGVTGEDSCAGDSGGPLMTYGKLRSAGVRLVQRGIVSIGAKRCGRGGRPGIYTNVAWYIDWILDNMRD